MDDPNARPEFSRGATLEDLIELCQYLNEAGVQYIVIGGFAVIHYGLLRATNDIDLLVDTTTENEQKLKKAMLNLPDKAIMEVAPGDIEKYQVVRVADEIVVDLMAKACSVTYEQATSYIEYAEIQGIKIPYLKPEMLIKTKETIRPKDAADKEYLEELLKRQKEPGEKKTWWRW